MGQASLLFLLLLAADATGKDLPAKDAPPSVKMEKGDVLIGRYRLTPKPSGGYRARTDAFTAFVARDGAVTFEDPPRLPGPAVLPALVVGELLESKMSNYARSPLDQAKQYAKRPSLVLADDDLRRDPRHAQKMEFIETTAHFREGLRRRNDGTALGAFRRLVDSAASDPKVPAAGRRQSLHELWAECDEGERGAPARAVVEEAARRHFPAGSRDAYTPAELGRFPTGGSGLRFDPYAVTSPAVTSPAPTFPRSLPTR